MPEFAIVFQSRPGGQAPAPDVVLEHCEYLERISREGHVIAAGPFTDGKGDGLLLGCFADLEEARLHAMADPFVRKGFMDAQVRPWTWSHSENGQLDAIAPRPGVFPAFLDALHLRGTVRDFTPAPIPRPLLKRVLDAACRAPSDFNIQPWRPVVVVDESDRKRLQACCFHQPHIGRAAADVICCVDPDSFHTDAERSVEERITGGSLKPEQRTHHVQSVRNFFPDPQMAAMRNGAIFGQQLLVAALSQGIAGAWTGGFRSEAVKQQFAIPDYIFIVGIIALGWPKGPQHPMPRLPTERTVSWGTWGGRESSR